jgi:hypothetical protein|tara:strand:+ start:375 stop:1007 length:633 start_codon:yes stop_codon:yes gene_type:complete
MKKLLNEWNEFINESSISRSYEHILKHDTGFLTAFRDNTKDTIKCISDHSKTLENFERNKQLKAVLLNKGYGVTAVDGTYIEDFGTEAAKEVKEDSLFIVNLKDNPNFKADLRGLSEHFCQDSFLFVPRGGEQSFLVGTNKAEFPGYGNEEETGEFLGGQEGEFMTRVGKSKRPIKFAEGLETKTKMQNNTKFLISRLAKQVLQEMKGDN